MNSLEFTHRRKNLLTNEWILVSPQRNNRPWQGAVESHQTIELPTYEQTCPLCPGNARASGDMNPDYQDTFCFVNDFGALTKDQTNQPVALPTDSIFTVEAASGECRVICYSPTHNKTLPEMDHESLIKVVQSWQQNYQELSRQYECVHIFENKGAIMGCSQPHPHGQIWAHHHWSTEIEKENQNQLSYFQETGSCLLNDYLQREALDPQRVISENEHWIALVPFWAAWPFEVLLVAKHDIRHFGQLGNRHRIQLADILQDITRRYDKVFNCSFPYSMGWHSAPKNLENNQHWRLHAHFYPPLLRSAAVKKFMVGYEMLAEAQRDITPESAAEILRAVSPKHHKRGEIDVS